MSGWLHKRKAVEYDVKGIVRYLRRDSPRVARRFLRAVSFTLRELRRMPQMGSPIECDDPALVGLRYFRIREFPNHVIYYRPIPKGIEVFRVLHGAQDADRLLAGEE